MWRVETRDADGNRGRGDLVAFFVADEQEPLSVSGEVTISAGVFESGSFIRIEATDSPTFPGGTTYSFVHITPSTLSAVYTLYNVPHTNPVYLHAIWDADLSYSFTVGDYTGVTMINTEAATDPVIGVNVDLSTVVAGASSFSGTIACPAWLSSHGNIYVAILNDGDDDQPLDTAMLTAPGAYSMPDPTQIPVGGWVSVVAFWDTDGTGTLTPTDQVVVEEDVHVSTDNVVDVTIGTQGFVSGTVLAADGLTPVSGKQVTIEGNDFRGFVFTDETGYYAQAVPDGQYRVMMNPYYNGSWENYQPNEFLVLYYDGHYTYDSADLVTVNTVDGAFSSTTGAATEIIPYVADAIDFTMQQGVYISGRVTDSSGTPLPDISMVAVAGNEQDISPWVVTDGNGEYSVLVPPNGSYYVKASPQDGWGGPSQPYINQYWGGVKPWEGDPPNIAVVEEAVTDKDFTLQGATFISGMVTRENGGTAISDVWVEAFDFDTGQFVEGDNSGTDGSYSIVVPPGVYKVRVCPTCNQENPQPYLEEYYDDTDFDQAAAVNTESGDQGGIDFLLADAMKISGYVRQDDGSTAIADLHVYSVDSTSQEWHGGSDTDAEGYYEIFVPPGTYKIRACASCSSVVQPYLDIFYQDSAGFETAAVIDVSAQNQTDINFYLDAATLITGTVVAEVGSAPIADMHVYAENLQGQWVAAGNTSENGDYFLPVPVGDYKVAVCPTCNNWGGTDIYIKEYFDDAPDAQSAATITTSFEGEQSADFALALGMQIAGSVYRSSDSSLLSGLSGGDLIIQVYSGLELCEDGMQLVAAVEIGQDGSYLTPALSAGTYFVRAQPQCINFAQKTCAADEEVVLGTGSGTHGDVDFYLDAGGTISGYVEDKDNNRLTWLPLNIIDTESQNLFSAGSGESGSYCVGVPAGTYRVEACASCNNHSFINQNYDGQYHQSYTPVSVSNDQGTGGINFHLSRIVMGDVNGDERVDVTDAVLGLKVMTDSVTPEPIFNTGEVNGDNRIGMPEVLYILNEAAAP
jgi:hypothetical protein